MNRAVIQARRDALAAQLEQGTQQYDHLEAKLKQIDRQLCVMAGGIQELDALLGLPEEEPPVEPPPPEPPREEPCADSPTPAS